MTILLESLKTGEAVEIGAEDVALEGEVGEFSLTLDMDEAGVCEFLHVVGQGGGADGLRLGDAGTGRGAVAAADLREDFITAWRGEGTGDEGELTIGDCGLLRSGASFLCDARGLCCHRLYLTPGD
jgi:hypothetical protein